MRVYIRVCVSSSLSHYHHPLIIVISLSSSSLIIITSSTSSHLILVGGVCRDVWLLLRQWMFVLEQSASYSIDRNLR